MFQHIIDNCNLRASWEDLNADRAYTVLTTSYDEIHVWMKLTAWNVSVLALIRCAIDTSTEIFKFNKNRSGRLEPGIVPSNGKRILNLSNKWGHWRAWIRSNINSLGRYTRHPNWNFESWQISIENGSRWSRISWIVDCLKSIAFTR